MDFPFFSLRCFFLIGRLGQCVQENKFPCIMQCWQKLDLICAYQLIKFKLDIQFEDSTWLVNALSIVTHDVDKQLFYLLQSSTFLLFFYLSFDGCESSWDWTREFPFQTYTGIGMLCCISLLTDCVVCICSFGLGGFLGLHLAVFSFLFLLNKVFFHQFFFSLSMVTT